MKTTKQIWHNSDSTFSWRGNWCCFLKILFSNDAMTNYWWRCIWRTTVSDELGWFSSRWITMNTSHQWIGSGTWRPLKDSIQIMTFQLLSVQFYTYLRWNRRSHPISIIRWWCGCRARRWCCGKVSWICHIMIHFCCWSHQQLFRRSFELCRWQQVSS